MRDEFTFTLRRPKFHNWKTSVAWLLSLLAYAVSHQNEILPVLPERYRPGANTAFILFGLIGAFLTKDAGNHSTAQQVADATAEAK